MTGSRRSTARSRRRGRSGTTRRRRSTLTWLAVRQAGPRTSRWSRGTSPTRARSCAPPRCHRSRLRLEGGPLALPAAYSRRGQGAAPRRVHVQERVPAPGAAALHDGGPQQELARPRRGARRGGLRGIAVCSSWQEGQGARRGQGAGEARGLAGGGPLRGGEPRRRRRLPQRHPNAG